MCIAQHSIPFDISTHDALSLRVAFVRWHWITFIEAG